MPKRPKQHKPEGWKPYDRAALDQRRGSAGERGYGWTWQKFRDRFLKDHPLCVYCMNEGRPVQATVVDHIAPHRGDMELFWKQGNHQSLCATHHNSIKQREEKKAARRRKDTRD